MPKLCKICKTELVYSYHDYNWYCSTCEKNYSDVECLVCAEYKKEIRELKASKDLYNEQAHIACQENQKYINQIAEKDRQIEELETDIHDTKNYYEDELLKKNKKIIGRDLQIEELRKEKAHLMDGILDYTKKNAALEAELKHVRKDLCEYGDENFHLKNQIKCMGSEINREQSHYEIGLEDRIADLKAESAQLKETLKEEKWKPKLEDINYLDKDGNMMVFQMMLSTEMLEWVNRLMVYRRMPIQAWVELLIIQEVKSRSAKT